MSILPVSDVEPGDEVLPTGSILEAVGSRPGGAIEAVDPRPGNIFATEEHPFVAAARLAFAFHLPLALRPDDVWLVLVQGLAQHVALDPEGLRRRLVAHTGKPNLVVRRDEFVRGRADNDWAGVFPEFGEQIREHVGKRHDLIVGSFSTSTVHDHAISNLALMDVMQAYFDYTVVTRCGIPSIRLMGTAADWRSIRDRARVFAEFDLGWWCEALEPILTSFVDSAEDRHNPNWWRSFYKENDQSGGPYVTGWINTLFPCIQVGIKEPRIERNPYAADWTHRDGWGGGPPSRAFGSGLRSVPFTWDYLGDKLPMTFEGGFVGVEQDPESRELAPWTGWAVRSAGG